MNDASLDHDILEDGLSAFFQTGYAVHADEKDVFYTAAFDFVKYLHPVVFSLWIPLSDPQHVFDPVQIVAQDNLWSDIIDRNFFLWKHKNFVVFAHIFCYTDIVFSRGHTICKSTLSKNHRYEGGIYGTYPVHDIFTHFLP